MVYAVIWIGKNTFKDEIRDYYCGLTFTETLIKHGTKSNKDDFGEEEMKKRRHKKDYIKIIPEKNILQDMSVTDTVKW